MAYTFQVADFTNNFSDALDSPANNFAGVRISSLSLNGGLLTNNNIAAFVGMIVTKDDIAGGNLKFQPKSNAFGGVSFGFQVRDDGGTAGGGVDTDASPSVMNITVSSVNDAPTGESRNLTTSQSSTYTFTKDDFPMSDASDSPQNNLKAITVTALNLNGGSLKFNNVDVTVGQPIPATAHQHRLRRARSSRPARLAQSSPTAPSASRSRTTAARPTAARTPPRRPTPSSSTRRSGR